MSVTFSILDEGWIPVVAVDGSRRLLGVRQILEQAHTLLEISDQSPLDEYSMYRFLGLFLMDALRPEEEESIEDILQTGSFDMTLIEQYIAQCQAEGVSFDLFDEKRPFLQTLKIEEYDGKEKPVAVLDCTMPSGNNHTHFIHMGQDILSPEVAVKKLLSTYWFCTAGAQGYPSGVYGAPPYFGVIRGNTLFDTLVNLLLPIDSIGLCFDDPPVLWRRNAPIRQKAEIGNTSWLHGMLFPTRRIRLIPDESGIVTGVHLSQGENYVNKEAWRDPYVTYRSNETSFFPLRPHADNPIWRNVCDIIDIPGEHASRLLGLYRSIHGNRNIRLTLYGAETSQASYLSIFRHDLELPLGLAEQESIELLNKCIASANQLSRTLYRALDTNETIPKAVAKTAEQSYERVCEGEFWKTCRLVATESDVQGLYSDYVTVISESVDRQYNAALSTVNLKAHALAVAAENRKSIYLEINKLKKEAGI